MLGGQRQGQEDNLSPLLSPSLSPLPAQCTFRMLGYNLRRIFDLTLFLQKMFPCFPIPCFGGGIFQKETVSIILRIKRLLH